MVPRLLTNYQLETLNRQQIREIERKHKKAFNKLRKLTSKSNLSVFFDNCTVTNFGNFGLFESFKKAIGFQEMLQKYVTVYRHHNCRYSAAELIDTMIDCIALGIVRFDHMNSLKFDSGYQKVKDVDQVPDERTLRHLISRFTPRNIDELKMVNREILSLKAKMENPREIWLDFDDTVITVFGNQEGSEAGYNPRYHGRRSYKARVGFITETGELLNAGLYGGKANSNNGFLDFFKETISLVGSRTPVKGVRLDRGFLTRRISFTLKITASNMFVRLN